MTYDTSVVGRTPKEELRWVAIRRLSEIFKRPGSEDESNFPFLARVTQSIQPDIWGEDRTRALILVIKAAIAELPDDKRPLNCVVTWRHIGITLYGFRKDLEPRVDGQRHTYDDFIAIVRRESGFVGSKRTFGRVTAELRERLVDILNVIEKNASAPSQTTEKDWQANKAESKDTIHRDLTLNRKPQSVPVPRQLPASSRWFIGRDRELAVLSSALAERHDGAGGTVVISAIGGTGGIGKTWLALHWAHHNLARFPDGQLYVNLRGFDPTGQPMAVGAAVRSFLDAFEIDPGRIPVELDAQAALYRSLVAGKRMLIMLDNARDTSQVTPLLPGSSSCTVVVTSRHQLTGLVTTHDARPLSLDVLTETEARELLVRRIGVERVAYEPEAVEELLIYCAGLPLALGIVTARAATYSHLSLTVLAAELRDASTRLAALDGGDPQSNVAAMLSWSYHTLSSQVAKVFCLLGLAPGPEISLPAVASLTGLITADAASTLRVLERLSLLQQHKPGRWRMHDLVKLYAADQARHDQSDNARDTALRRLIDFYLQTAYTADRLINPRRPPIEIDSPIPGCCPPQLVDQATAWVWFAAEHTCLLAAQKLAVDRGWHSAVWQLTWAVDTFHYRRGHLHDRLIAWRVGLSAAQHEGNSTAIFTAHRLFGHACVRVGRYTEALDHLEYALEMAKDAEDLLNQAHTHTFFVKAWEQQGNDRQALKHATKARYLFQTLGYSVWEAQALNAMGRFAARLGHYIDARDYCDTALLLCRRNHDSQGETEALSSLGDLAHLTSQHDQALEFYQQTLSRYHNLGHTYYEADLLDRLGQTHAALGNHDQARDAWQQALQLYQDQHRTVDVDRVQQQLDGLDEWQDVHAEFLDGES